MDDLTTIFNALKALLAAYVPPFVVTVDQPARYELWSRKPVEIAGRKYRGVFFGSVVMRKGYIGLYYMPVYAEPDMLAMLAPDLLKLLRGKSCFHIKALSPELNGHIKTALQLGVQRYREQGWV